MVAAAAQEATKQTKRAIGITFDDGWLWALDRGAAELAARSMPATFFITTGFLGRPFFATAANLKGLDPTLFTIGSHGSTHRMLSSLPPSDIRSELMDSKAVLEDITGRLVTALSIPGGAVDHRVVAIAAEVGYQAIFDSSIAVNPTAGGPHSIGRIGIDRLTSPERFTRWLRFDLRRERLRKAALSLPKRMLGMKAYSWTRRLLLGEFKRDQHFFKP